VSKSSIPKSDYTVGLFTFYAALMLNEIKDIG